MLPRIAIVGRPNVGKSSLFNRLAGRRVAIVDPTPGTTRDRIEAVIDLRPSRDEGESVFADLFDTGGWGVYTAEGGRFDDAGKDLTTLTPEIEGQILSAARGADVILFVFDARTGPMPLDLRVVELLRRERLVERVVAVANKVDDGSVESEVAALAKFGFGVPLPVSAKSGRGLAKLRALLRERAERIRAERGDGAGAEAGTPDAPGADGAPAGDERHVNPELDVAIVGRRNAGKSSLVNALAGQPRVIVSEIAGTTRDSVDVRLEIDGRVMTVIDTAGVRKRKSWDGDIEYYANLRVQESIRRADVCVLLLDAVEKVSLVEKNLAMQLTEAYKPTVIAVNKWDLVGATLKPRDYLDYLGQELPGLAYAPIVFVSARDHTGLRDLVAMCFNLAAQAAHRETTGRVNAAVGRILTERGPSSALGSRAKVFYVTQIDVKPPTLALVVNRPELFEGSYARFLENRLRDELPFSEVPIRLVFSARRRDEWGEGAGGGEKRAGGRAKSAGTRERGAGRRETSAGPRVKSAGAGPKSAGARRKTGGARGGPAARGASGRPTGSRRRRS